MSLKEVLIDIIIPLISGFIGGSIGSVVIIKNKYIEYVIFIKVKNRYYTYDKEDKGKYIILKGNIMEVKCEK